MANYVVEKEFLDRFDNHRHLIPGEPHEPHSEDRANHLMELGFISKVEEVPKVEEPKPNSSKKKGGTKKDDVKPEGDPDDKAPASE